MKKKKRETNEVAHAKNLHLILDHLCCIKSPFPQVVWNVWMRDVFALFVGIFLKKKKVVLVVIVQFKYVVFKNSYREEITTYN